jgi:hypothetical protein
MSGAVTTRVFGSQSAPIVLPPHSATPFTAEQKVAQEAFVNSQLKNDEIAQLRAEQKRINDALRAVNAANAAKKEARDAMKANQPSE